MNPTIEPFFKEVAQNEGDIATAFADKVMANSGLTSSNVRDRGRSTTSVDQIFDKHFNRVANVENNRILARMRDNGQLGLEDRLPTANRVTQYDAVKGIYTADERFRPEVDEAYRLGNALAKAIGWNGERTLAGIKMAHARYTQEAYLATEGMEKYVKIEDLCPKEVEELAETLDNEAEVVETA